MARTTKKKETAPETTVVTRAEKKDATKNIIREILAIHPQKHNELIDEVAKLYTERYGDESDNVNDVKGRVGSVLDIMKKESDVMYDGGMYALKARIMPAPVMEELPAAEAVGAEETPAPKKRARKTKAKAEEPAPVEETKAEPAVQAAEPAPVAEAVEEEKPAPKKRGRKPKAKTVEVPAEVVAEPLPAAEPEKAELAVEEKEELPAPAEEVKTEEAPAPVKEESKQLVIREKQEIKPVMDMSFLFGAKPARAPEKKAEEKKEAEKKPESVKEVPKVEVKQEEKPKTERREPVKTEGKPTPKAEVKPVEKAEQKPAEKPQNNRPKPQTNVRKLPQGATVRRGARTEQKPLTAEEKLRDNFLKKVRSLGGDYFEYYSVYLLERYSMKNGRRLESLRICGGDNDGGIDGEIELTDKLGFKETIYIQSKNWNPEKGDERLWVVGETLLQQFIGACACRQAKDGKQNCRGIFITTSRFTPEAKRILDTMSDKIVGYDGNDLFEAAKECSFGVTQKNGQWALDENLLSGIKAFFNL